MSDNRTAIKAEILRVLNEVTPNILALKPFFKEDEEGWIFQGEPREFEKAVVEIHDQFRKIDYAGLDSSALFLLHVNAAMCFRMASAIACENEMTEVEDILDYTLTLIEHLARPERPDPSAFVEEITRMIAAGVPVDEAMKSVGEKAGATVHKINIDGPDKPTLH